MRELGMSEVCARGARALEIDCRKELLRIGEHNLTTTKSAFSSIKLAVGGEHGGGPVSMEFFVVAA